MEAVNNMYLHILLKHVVPTALDECNLQQKNNCTGGIKRRF